MNYSVEVYGACRSLLSSLGFGFSFFKPSPHIKSFSTQQEWIIFNHALQATSKKYFSEQVLRGNAKWFLNIFLLCYPYPDDTLYICICQVNDDQEMILSEGC